MFGHEILKKNKNNNNLFDRHVLKLLLLRYYVLDFVILHQPGEKKKQKAGSLVEGKTERKTPN